MWWCFRSGSASRLGGAAVLQSADVFIFHIFPRAHYTRNFTADAAQPPHPPSSKKHEQSLKGQLFVLLWLLKILV